MQKIFAVGLTIPDNEAFTAQETLVRMGIAVDHVMRSDIWIFTVDEAAAGVLAEAVATIETIFNPNKHRLEVRADSRPLAGEVWIAPSAESPMIAVGGRTIPGVSAIHRATAWRLLDAEGADVEPAQLARALEFLCNPAFQKATR